MVSKPASTSEIKPNHGVCAYVPITKYVLGFQEKKLQKKNQSGLGLISGMYSITKSGTFTVNLNTMS